MARVKTYANGSTLLPADLDSIQDDYENAFSSYRTIQQRGCFVSSTNAAGTYAMSVPGNPGVGGVVSAFSAEAKTFAFHLDPADHAAGSRTVKLRTRAICFTNGTAPAQTFTVSLYQVSTWSTAATGATTIAALGANVTTHIFTTPALNTITPQTSADVTLTTAGYYTLVIAWPGAIATNAVASFLVNVQMRQV